MNTLKQLFQSHADILKITYKELPRKDEFNKLLNQLDTNLDYELLYKLLPIGFAINTEYTYAAPDMSFDKVYNYKKLLPFQLELLRNFNISSSIKNYGDYCRLLIHSKSDEFCKLFISEFLILLKK